MLINPHFLSLPQCSQKSFLGLSKPQPVGLKLSYIYFWKKKKADYDNKKKLFLILPFITVFIQALGSHVES